MKSARYPELNLHQSQKLQDNRTKSARDEHKRSRIWFYEKNVYWGREN